MKFIHPSKARVARFILGAFMCLMLFVSSAVPAFAAGSSQSSLQKGEAKLDKTLEKSQEVLKSPPLSLEDVESRSNKGLNEVQEDADIGQMKRSDNTAQTTSVPEKIERALEKVTGNR